MNLNFLAVLAALGRDAAFRIANTARPSGDYLFASLLPEERRPSYHAEAGNMTIRSTMAGLVGMDSPYPPGGHVSTSTFAERTAKMAIQVPLNEATLRHLQELSIRLLAQRRSVDSLLSDAVLNFADKVLTQSLLDVTEWLRGQALVTGAIDWTFNKIRLQVTYGVPAANLLTNRAGNDAYSGSASKFWTDLRTARRKLRTTGVRVLIAHPDTIDDIRYNTVNALVPIDEGAGFVTFRKHGTTAEQFTLDSTDRVTILSYDKEGEVIDPDNAGQTIKVPFMPTGKILVVGNNEMTGFAVGVDAGSTPPITNRLGYTHLAPTIEGGGEPGRWADIYTPQNEPYKIEGRAAQNVLPVIEAPAKIVVMSTDMAA